MQAALLDPQPPMEDVRTVFARSARVALAGLLAAPVLLGLASSAGYPLRTAVDPAFWLSALAGFGGAGWWAGRRLELDGRRQAALASAYLATALPVAAAFRGLQGTTGHESILAVSAATLPAFGIAFALAGILSARAIGTVHLGLRGVAACTAGGLLGGALAMLPFCWAWLRLDVPGETFVVMTVAAVGFLGCLIAPFHVVGHALDRSRTQG
jgi:hypothetical protein